MTEAYADLSDRQARELDYHRDRAAQHADRAAQPVSLDVLTSKKFRWWNAYWVVVREARRVDLAGKRALVIGCGFGEDAILLSRLGADVSTIDLSPESIEIARRRANRFGGRPIEFAVAPAEDLPYAGGEFDFVYLPDVLHHLDIPATMREIRRVLKPGGVLIGNEPYTHSWVQAGRDSGLARRLYARMIRHIYSGETPYITPDERKLTERDFRFIGETFRVARRQYFSLFTGRLFPINCMLCAKVDRLLLMLPGFGHLLAGRVVFSAHPGRP